MDVTTEQLGEPIETSTATPWWHDWRGEDVLRYLHDDQYNISAIVWNVTTSEDFEKAKRFSTGRVLCVTGKHPTDEAVKISE